MDKNNLKIQYLDPKVLSPASYNPRKWSQKAIQDLTDSINRYGLVDPIICNSAKGRENVVIGGHFRLKIAKDLGYKTVPVVYVNIPNLEKEKELNLRLNKNTGEFDFKLLAEFDESFLVNLGFSSEELDDIFDIDIEPEKFDLQKELAKLDIKNIQTKKGDVYELDGSRLMCGDSTIEADMLKLMNGVSADMCLTDPPYILNYLKGKKKHKSSEGFGYKRDRRYLGTDSLPDNFTELWMKNIAKIAKDDFHIIVYENWKNLRTIWAEMEKYWKVKNMIVWRLPNRTQGFAAKYKFFSKHDIAMVGSSKDSLELNLSTEETPLQNEYETALYAIAGKPHWEGYQKGKKYAPTDFIDYKASDEKSSGQGVIFGTKPVEILIPYIKVLTKRDDLIVEPFGGSGSTLIAATKMKRRCYIMEKSPVYTEVIKKRWKKLTGKKTIKLHGHDK
ncbi:MAG: DNA methyltransferase [Patescibacteria group bacterium]